MLADKIINKYAFIGAVYGLSRSYYWLNKKEDLLLSHKCIITMFTISSSIAVWPYFILDDYETKTNKKDNFPFPFNV